MTRGKVSAELQLKPSWAICISESNSEKEKVVLGNAVGIWVCLAPQR